MTGGSGVLTAVILPLEPTMTDVAVLSDKSVGAVEMLVERAVQSLPAADIVL